MSEARFKINEGDENSILRIRNSLPQLQRYKSVFYDFSNQFWLVDLAYTLPSLASPSLDIPLRIGERPVYVFDSQGVETIIGRTGQVLDFDPHTVCGDAELWRVAEAFPHSIGINVHKYGHVYILYENDKHLRRGQDSEFPGSIGGMTWSRKVINMEAPSSQIPAGMQIAGEEDESNCVLGCVGLKIRRI